MVQTKLRSDPKRLSMAQRLDRGQQDLFLHADVLEETTAEFCERSSLDVVRVARGAAEQMIEATMILLEVFSDSFCIHRQLHPGGQIVALLIRLVPQRDERVHFPG